MSATNNFTLLGRLTRDPELRTTPNGKNVVTFGIAVTKRFKPTDGSPDADFFDIKAWGVGADYAANYLAKGKRVLLHGTIQTESYTNNEGKRITKVVFVAEDVQGVDRPTDDEKANAAPKPKRTTSHTPPSVGLNDDGTTDPFASGAQ